MTESLDLLVADSDRAAAAEDCACTTTAGA
jgi:hypothetical protein